MKSTTPDVPQGSVDISTEKLNVVFNPKTTQSTIKVLVKRKEFTPFFTAKKPVVVIPRKGKSFSDYLTRVTGTNAYKIPKPKNALSLRAHDVVLILFPRSDNYYATQCEVSRVLPESYELAYLDLRRGERIKLDCPVQIYLIPETVKQQLLAGTAGVRRIWRGGESFLEEVLILDDEDASIIKEKPSVEGVIKDISIGGLKIQIEGKASEGAGRGSLLYLKYILKGSGFNAGFSVFTVVRAAGGCDDASRFLHCSFLEEIDALEDLLRKDALAGGGSEREAGEAG